MPKDQRASLGKKGEDIAAGFLEGIGFKVLERNWKYGRKDIDIVCEDGKTIVFVEVKAVGSEEFNFPFERVNRRKQKNISQVAEFFIQQRNCSGCEFRFDVVAIDTRGGSARIRHIRNAFMVPEPGW